MSGYSFERDFLVNYADCDFRDLIKPSSLLVFTQEVAGESADELGFGYDVTKRDGCGFFIVATCCEIYKPIRPYDRLTVSTWPLPPRRVIFERNYEVKRAGEKVAALASRWCLVDLNTQKLLPPERLKAHAGCPYRDEQTISPDWSLPKLRGEGENVYSMTARLSNCDHFRHVNNTKYADFFMDCFSEEELDKRRIKSFRIAYARQVRAGSTLTFFRKNGEGETFLEAVSEGEPTTRFSVAFEDL